MLTTDLKSALRSMRRYAGTTTLNAIGLTLALVACVLIGAFVQYEGRVDAFHDRADRLVRLNKEATTQAGGTEHHAISSGQMGPTLVAEHASVEQAVRVLPWFNPLVLGHGDTYVQVEDVVFADSNFFSVFDFDLVHGNPASVLDTPRALVLTESTAQRLFGDANPVGETVDHKGFTYTVTGVAADPPMASHLRFNAVVSWATTVPGNGALDYDWLNNWKTQVLYTYLLLAPEADRTALAAHLGRFIERHLPERADQYHLYLQPFNDIYLGSAHLRFTDGLRLGNRTYVIGLAIIGVLILVIACVNVTNLAMAQALRRRREMGVRKTLGAEPRHLLRQLMTETFMLCAGSMVVALCVASAVLPAFGALVNRPLTAEALYHPWVWGGSIVLVVITTVASGAYPAARLVRVHPARALKSRGGGRLGRWSPQQVLVTFQFAAAMALIAGASVVFQQLRYVQSKDLGFDTEQIVTLPIGGTAIARQYEAFEEELQRGPGVAQVTFSDLTLGQGSPTFEIHPEHRTGDETWLVQRLRVGSDDFLDTYGMSLVAGRSFDASRALDSTRAVIVNETLVRTVGWGSPQDALGKRLDIEGELEDGVVIGVVEDFHVESLRQAIEPLAMWMAPRRLVASVRLSGADMAGLIEHLRQTWRSFERTQPFQYAFLDTRFAEAYRADQRMMRLLGAFAGLAVVVACLGLFGLAAYAAQQREREVGIRKALGATVAQIVGLLTADFLKLVVLASVLAVPVAYWAAGRWLEDFAYRIELGPMLFAGAGTLVLLMAFGAVGAQALRAARTDPASVLHGE